MGTSVLLSKTCLGIGYKRESKLKHEGYQIIRESDL